MKTKQFDKKMGLNKKTIVNLDNGEQRAVDGGKLYCATGEVDTCISYNDYKCCTTYPITSNPPQICPSC
jgi:hypothetical protein